MSNANQQWYAAVAVTVSQGGVPETIEGTPYPLCQQSLSIQV